MIQVENSFLDTSFVPGENIFRIEHPGVTAVFGRFMEPLEPMPGIGEANVERLRQQVGDGAEMESIRNRIEGSNFGENCRVAGIVNRGSVIASGAIGTAAFFTMLKEAEPTTLFRAMASGLFGIYGGMVGSKLIEVPARLAIDKFRMRQQEKHTREFLDCELGPVIK